MAIWKGAVLMSLERAGMGGEQRTLGLASLEGSCSEKSCCVAFSSLELVSWVVQDQESKSPHFLWAGSYRDRR